MELVSLRFNSWKPQATPIFLESNCIGHMADYAYGLPTGQTNSASVLMEQRKDSVGS